jgi:hypothetical protein
MIRCNQTSPLGFCQGIALGAALCILPQVADASQMRCQFEQTYVCNARSGCMAGATSQVEILIRPDAKLYGRCDIVGSCDWYAISVQISGGYLNIGFTTGIQGAKVSLDGLKIIETSALLDVVFISFGRCQR